MYPPKAEFTEANVPDLSSKVIIVTGGYAGIGYQLSKILYSKNAKVYIAARSEEKANGAIKSIKESSPQSTGSLSFLSLDLADLTTIKASVNAFRAKENQLHILFNNAGVMTPPQGSKTAQGYELQLGTNNIGSFLFTKLLTPTIVATAKQSPKDSVRVVWVSSSAVDFAPKPGGIVLDNLDYHDDKSAGVKYGISKVGNFLHAVEYARRYGADSGDGVVSIALNPGNLTTELVRHRNWLEKKIITSIITHPPVNGAYTELFAGFSDQITTESVKTNNWGKFEKEVSTVLDTVLCTNRPRFVLVVPWGRLAKIRKDIDAEAKPTSEGGSALAEKFWEWTEEQVKPYL